LPLQGERGTPGLPRVLPWAIGSLAFQAVLQLELLCIMKKPRAETPRRGNEHLAQGNTLGVGQKGNRLVKAKALSCCWAFALTGREGDAWFTQGVALGYRLAGLSGRTAA